MPRTKRAAIGGMVYHVLNRGNGKMKIFRKDGDFQAFVDLMILARAGTRALRCRRTGTC